MTDLLYDLNSATLLTGSESSDGLPLTLDTFTALGAGRLLHIATSEADEWDEIQLYATNRNAAARVLNVSVGVQDVAHTLAVNLLATTTVLACTLNLRGGNSVWAYCGGGAVDVSVWLGIRRRKGKMPASTSA